eukprot:358321-Chlamydomonas_euryale.AAC.1
MGAPPPSAPNGCASHTRSQWVSLFHLHPAIGFPAQETVPAPSNPPRSHLQVEVTLHDKLSGVRPGHRRALPGREEAQRPHDHHACSVRLHTWGRGGRHCRCRCRPGFSRNGNFQSCCQTTAIAQSAMKRAWAHKVGLGTQSRPGHTGQA